MLNTGNDHTVVHDFANCPMLHIVREFVKINLKGVKGKIITAVLLFGLSINLQRAPSKTRALDITLSSIPSYLAKKMNDNEIIKNEDIKAIIISTAARYNAFSIRIPGTDNIPWKYAGDLVRFYPSISNGHLQFLQRILRAYKKFNKTPI
ncbi:Uncharacterized protein FKW44_011674 [Caligus rogercresseyi]|uniref:Uncharacterized protein n=1 Tax=Caligus rogercresseyi TaxID=217165 RepID=A0A7T8K915_CALRO|nr:Uncharacterized protein FKW44_011674 [Caligus rogercresseyi]